MDKLKNSIRTGKAEKEHNWIELAGHENRNFLIVGYPYVTNDKEERNNGMMTILDSEGAKKARGAIIIGFNLNRNDYPYSVLACKLDSVLFDTL